MVGFKGVVTALCVGLLPLSAMGQGQAYWLPPAAGGGVAPSSPYTSGFSVQPQSFYSGAGAVSAPPAGQSAPKPAGAAPPQPTLLEVNNKLRGSKSPSHK